MSAFYGRYAANAMALERTTGKENALEVLALLYLLLIIEVGAPRHAVDDLSAPSKPVIPLETILPHLDQLDKGRG